MTNNPLIVALDVESTADARTLVARIGSHASLYKIGIELYAAAGMEFVRELAAHGKDVFLDMKYFDIGAQVRRAVAQVARAGVRFLTVHAQPQVMRAAVEGRGDSELKLLAVTVLTSFDQTDIEADGYTGTVASLVERRARNAVAAGVDGMVASPLEVAAVRAIAGPTAILVTPGVRSVGADPGDQKRVATPAQALRDGADYVVVGRQITRAADPAVAAARLREEIAAR